MLQYFSNNTNSNNNTNFNIIATDERPNILAWLSPLEPRLRHRDLQERRVENVGQWILQTEEFRSWYAGSGGSESDHAVLYCHGDPGAGKTFISSLVIDSLCDRAGGQNVAVACFYFDFAAQKEQSPTSMLGALLKQVVGGLEEVPGEIAQAYGEQKKVIGGRVPQLSDIVKMLQATSSEKRTFICIDALDECVEGHRVKILDSLKQILEKSPATRVFLTGRPHIRPEIERRLTGRVGSVCISPKRDDIIGYLHTRLGEDTNPDAMDSSLEADILKKIPQEVSEIFLLVSLNIDAILQETTIHRRREKLSTMTDGLGLGDAYGAAIGRIKGQGGEKARLGLAALMWISHSQRPLKANELCHALAVEIGSPNLNADNAPSLGILLVCCQGLVVLDKEASMLRLVHFTLQEYLRAHPELFGAAHSAIAETCLSYLNSQQVRALSARRSPNLQDTPFLEYSSLYWGIHAQKDLSDCAKLLALKLFDDYNNHISSRILLEAHLPYWGDLDPDELSLLNGLHCASIFGIDEIVAGLVEVEGCDINQESNWGYTPLAWAASNGHERVVEILLGRDDVNPDEPNSGGETPLYHAIMIGHEGIVKMLLARDDVNPNEQDYDGRTPLYCAMENGHEGVVKILLGRDDVNPNEPSDYGETPLHLASRYGWEGAVKILLGRNDVNPNEQDYDGWTPLYRAVENGQEGVVKILLGRNDVNPNESDDDGWTPLYRAVENGHERVVKMLLGWDDVDPNKANNYGETPLHRAARDGDDRVVKMLLGRDDVNPNKQNNYGETPLHRAVRNGREKVVKMLLGRGDVSPDGPNNNGETPLHLAACGGRRGVVEMLIGRDDVDPNKADKYGQTPLWCVAENGYGGVAKMLLGRSDVNPDKPDEFGQTPLYAAAGNGHDEVVRILLERDDVNSDKPCKFGQTPLLWAAKNRRKGVMKIFLEQNCDNCRNLIRFSPALLSFASANGLEEVVKMLLRRGDIDPNKPDEEGQTPLYLAAGNGHEAVVKILLGRDDVNPDTPDNNGETPLHRAAWNGHEEVVKLLLRRDDVNPCHPDKLGRTPFWWATKRSLAGVIALLPSSHL